MSHAPSSIGLAAAGIFVGVTTLAMSALHTDDPRATETLVPTSEPASTFRPPPTENWLGENAESDNKARRKAHYARIHRAPPGVDWKLIERDNGLRRLSRRNTLATRPPDVELVAAWQERGSDNQAGRMHVARTSPDGTQLYAGSSLGGIWRGELDGTNWEPLGDNLYGGAHWLEVIEATSTSDPPILVVASDGGLIHTSTDDGETWVAPSGLDPTYGVRRLLRMRDGTDTLVMVVANDREYVVVRSTDWGASFQPILSLDGFAGDAWADRNGDSTLFVVTADGIQRSDDHGDTWVPLSGLPAETSRAELTGSEAGAPRLWMVTSGNALYRSDDAGESFEYVTEVYDYWGTLNASIQDVDRFAWGGVEVHYTEDAGAGWDVVNRWWEYYDDPANVLHADIPGLDVEVDAFGQEHWYIDTDGGLYESTDGLVSTQNLSLQGLRVSQYYDTHTSIEPPYHVSAGAQDQGYQFTYGVEQTDDVLAFEQAISGDYAHLTSSDGTHARVYSVYPGFILVQNNVDEPWLDYLDFPTDEAYSWIPPIVADPTDRLAFYFPARKLYRYSYSPGAGATYEAWSDEDFSEGGGDYISALTFSPLDPSRAYL
ncbi:MAG TPA: hypothetical protein DFR83_09830, partial [Deltaproteobacteria bacterium]|nr:hypothetical protein [Deltaproteobacteria bacterium]